jgi:DNA-binding NtrC family response regulator
MHGRAPAQPILVVEDDDDSREMLAAMLMMDGYPAISANILHFAARVLVI